MQGQRHVCLLDRADVGFYVIALYNPIVQKTSHDFYFLKVKSLYHVLTCLHTPSSAHTFECVKKPLLSSYLPWEVEGNLSCFPSEEALREVTRVTSDQLHWAMLWKILLVRNGGICFKI